MISAKNTGANTLDINMLQGQFIAKQGWVDRPYLAIAYRLVQQQNCDLCSLLEENRILNAEQCQRVRQAVRKYTDSSKVHRRDSAEDNKLEGVHEDRVVVPIDPSLVPSEQNDLETLNVVAPKPQSKIRSGTDHLETLIFAPPSGQFNSAEMGSYESYERPVINDQKTIDSLEDTVKKEKTNDRAHFFEPGDIFEHYRIEREIARGGMGVVFKAFCLQTEQTVAIKFILANKDVESVERFLREIKVLKKARHPCIVQILESGQHGSLFYFTMEYLCGANLVSLGTNKSQNKELQQEVLHYLHDVAGALEHCHSNGIIHRDVKPHNIVIDSETDRAVLIDFGIMKRVAFDSYESTDAATLTKTGQFMCSPAFMSPEQFGLEEFGTVTERSDVWSFGASMFFVLTGRTAFCESNVVRVMEAVTLGVIPELKDLNSTISPELNELCRSCMERNQALRPTMAEVRSRLGEILAPEAQISKFKLIFSVIALLVVGNLIGVLLFAKSTVKVLAVDAPKVTNKLEATITGEVSLANVLVQISRQEGERSLVLESVNTDANGRFSSTVGLLEGGNRVTVRTPEYESVVPWTVSVHCDSTQPGFSFPKHKTEGSLLIVDESLLLYGLVNEDQLASLTIEDKDCPCQTGGEFEFVVEDKATVQRLTLIAKDHAGNTGRKTVAFLTPKAIQAREKKAEPTVKGSAGQRRFSLADWNQENAFWTYSTSCYFKLRAEYLAGRLTLPKPKLPDTNLSILPTMSAEEKAQFKRHWSLLSDVGVWQQAGEKEQDRAIQFIANRLASDFVFVETSPYSFGSTRFRIATFKHRPTGIEFNLVPGGKQRIAERVLEIDKFLDLIVGKTGDISHVCDTLKIVSQPMLVSLGFYRAFKVDKKKTVGELITKILETKESLSILKTLGDSWGSSTKRGRSGQSSKSKIRLPEMQVGPLLVSRFEVSEEEWSQTAESKTTRSFPKVSVSVSEIDLWLKRVSGSLKLRLPSRWEWTHACLGPSKTQFFWEGKQVDSENYGWSVENSKQYLHNREDLKKPNAYGLYNTLGNVEEWCTSIWRGVVNKSRRALWPVAVGGHYNNSSLAMRASYFRYAGVNQRSHYCGFRVVVDLP
ncbi:MAG: protein kinase [Planctomycetota bacterium]|nr:protein kinase [Planctomycetota bacterium]